MAKLVLAFICIAFFQIATALKCYTCEREECNKDMSTWKSLECGNAINTFEMMCLTHTFKDSKDNKEYTVRKCETVTKNEPHKCPKLGDEVLCKTCNSDLCNSASVASLSFVAVCGVFIALLAPKLFS